VWSAGVVLHELLAGERPFARGSATATMKAILTEEPPDLRRSVGRDLAAIVQQALHKDRARRYASAGAFLADLRAWQVGGVIAARAPGAMERLLRWTRREPWRATAALLVVLLLPVATASLGYVWANAPRIEAAAAAERAQRREDALTTAWLLLPESPAPLGVGENDVGTGLAALDALGAPATDLEVAIARAALLLRAARRDEAIATLRPVADEPAAKFVTMQIEDRETGSFDFARAEAHTAIECFVLGVAAYEQVHVHKRDRSIMQHASRWLGSAVAMAQQPRAAFLFWWMVTATRAHDVPAVNAAFDAYAHHFPGSRGLRAAVLMCASEVPVERSLAILADLDLAQAPRANLALAQLYDRAGRLEDSERAWRAGLAADPKNLLGWLQLTLVLDKRKKFAEAAEAARAATEIDAQNAEAWRRLGTSLVQDGKSNEAREAFARAIELAPGVWSVHFNLGLIQWDAHEDEAALASFLRAAELAPSQPEPHVFGARVLRRLGRTQEALLYDLRALQCIPRDYRQWIVVCSAASDLGLHDVALVHAVRATELAPDNGTTWSRLAEVVLAMPQPDAARALAAAKKGDELAKGTNPRGVWILARAEAANGDAPGAIARLEALLAGAKDVPDAVRKLAEAELERLRTK
jgi:tetratricopeptide (TPR) repeat protein